MPGAARVQAGSAMSVLPDRVHPMRYQAGKQDDEQDDADHRERLEELVDGRSQVVAEQSQAARPGRRADQTEDREWQERDLNHSRPERRKAPH
jgi:hypothetical protein